MKDPLANVTIAWNDTRSTLTLTGSASGASGVRIYAGYGPNDYNYRADNQLVISDFNHKDHQFLYIRVVAFDGSGKELAGGEFFTAIQLKHPILGLVKTCDGDKNIIDFVEKRSGKAIERFKSGKRVVKIGTFNVTFYDGDTLIESVKVCEGGTVAPPTPPEKSDAKFAYWVEREGE